MDLNKLYEDTENYCSARERAVTSLNVNKFMYSRIRELAIKNRIDIGKAIDMAIYNLLTNAGIDFSGAPIVATVKKKKTGDWNCPGCYTTYLYREHETCPKCA